MKPTIVQGAVIVVDLNDKGFAERKIYVARTDDMIAAVKRVRKWKKGFFLVRVNSPLTFSLNRQSLTGMNYALEGLSGNGRI